MENSNYVPVTFESITMRSTVFEQTLNISTNSTQVRRSLFCDISLLRLNLLAMGLAYALALKNALEHVYETLELVQRY